MLFFYFFAAIQLFFGYKSLRGGIDYLRYFKEELTKQPTNYQPFASVIAPCRGIDDELESNLESLFKQNYKGYEVVFAVDSATDEAIPIIEKLIAKYGNSKLVLAGNATNCGQKVHNLRRAVLEISGQSDVLVFVDSDARPDKKWLGNLVAPLEDDGVGCSTGYRWFVQKQGGFFTQLRAVWNASIASTLGKNTKSNFCWGGSTAIRKELFEELEVREKWKGTLSDDFALTSILQDADLPIYFVPHCLTATVEDTGFSEMLEFTTRQMKITRVYSTKLWVMSFISAFLFTSVFWGGIILLFFAAGVHFWITLALILILFLLGVAKAWLRLNAVRLALDEYNEELRKQFACQISFWVLSPALFFYNNVRALFSRKIVWRGIEYELESSNRTIILKRDEH